MPSLKNELLDEEPGADQTLGFNGGQVSNARRNLLSPVQAAALQNVTLEQTGPAVTRRGVEQLSAETISANRVQGLAYFDTVTTQKLVRARNALIQVQDGTTGSSWTTESGYTPDATKPVAMVQGIKAGAQVLFLSDSVANPRSWNGSAFTDLGSGVPKAKSLVWFTNRLIASVLATAADTIYFSDLLDGGTFNLTTNSLRVGAGDGDPIVAVVPWTGTRLAVLKRASVWIVDADPATSVATMLIAQAPSPVGCAGPGCWARVGTDVWFLGTDMVLRSLSRVLQGADTNAPPISQPIADELAVINRAAVNKAVAVAYGVRFLLAFPSYSATEPDRVLSFNTQLQAWEGRWIGWAPTAWCVSYFSGEYRLNFGTPDGRVLRWRDNTPEAAETEADFEDAGEDIETSIDTRNHTFGEPLNPKRAFHTELEFNKCLTDEIDVTLIRDDVADATPVQTLTDGVDGIVLSLPGVRRAAINLLPQPPAREWGLRVRSSRLKMALRAVIFTAFIDTMLACSLPPFEIVPGSGFVPHEFPPEEVPPLQISTAEIGLLWGEAEGEDILDATDTWTRYGLADLLGEGLLSGGGEGWLEGYRWGDAHDAEDFDGGHADDTDGVLWSGAHDAEDFDGGHADDTDGALFGGSHDADTFDGGHATATTTTGST